MVQRAPSKASVTVTSASGATMPNVDDMASKSRRFLSLAARFSASRPCSIIARPLSAACASSVTTSMGSPSVRVLVDAEDQVLVGGELAVVDDGAVGERGLGAGVEVGLGHADVAQLGRQADARVQVRDRLRRRLA